MNWYKRELSCYLLQIEQNYSIQSLKFIILIETVTVHMSYHVNRHNNFFLDVSMVKDFKDKHAFCMHFSHHIFYLFFCHSNCCFLKYQIYRFWLNRSPSSCPNCQKDCQILITHFRMWGTFLCKEMYVRKLYLLDSLNIFYFQNLPLD